MPIKQAHTIQEVIDLLQEIIDHSQENNDPLGYFAALYQKVTIKVKEGIHHKIFEDNDRMERLDVIFANRYLYAYFSYQAKQATTASWQVAFDWSKKYWPIVLQHLLLGMNAHINLDLGIAAAEVMKGKDINDLENDFNKINEVLGSLVMNVEKDLSQIWPPLKSLLNISKVLDKLLVNFGMEAARDKAWHFACQLAEHDENKWPELIKEKDQRVAKGAKVIANPGFVANTILSIVRIGERGTVPQKIARMED